MIKVIHGPPCAGKTTYVKNNISSNDIVYDYDAISQALTYSQYQKTDYNFAHKYTLACRKVLLNKFKNDSEIDTAFLISTEVSEKLKEYLSDCNPEYIEMKTSKEECYNNLEKDNNRQDKDAWRIKIDEYFERKEKNFVNNTNLKITQRSFNFQTRAIDIEGEENKKELWVEGYAVTFNSPTVIFEIDGAEYKEQIAKDAFTDCKMDDVIFNYNHSGKVMARTRNKTLSLSIDEKGLFIRARLDGTEEGRRLYDEISKGYIDRMSFQFTISQEAYDNANHMWTVLRIKRLYDVSAVDIPAYDDTSIEARKSYISADDTAHSLERKTLELKLKLI